MVARTDSRPRRYMLGRGKLIDLDADFCQDTLRCLFADACDLINELDCLPPAYLLRGGKSPGFCAGRLRLLRLLWFPFSRIVGRGETSAYFLADSANRCIQRLNLLEMLSQHEAMMGSDLSRQGAFQFLLTGANPSRRQRCQP